MIQDNNMLITTEKGEGKLPLFYGNGERETPFYNPRSAVIIRELRIKFQFANGK